MRTMSRIKKRSKPAKDTREKDLDKILDSNACRKLFTWARPKDAGASAQEMDAEIKEEQRLRWNFDFDTETPLPGRYQWMRSDYSNGHHKNGDGNKIKNRELEHRPATQKFNTPYNRKSRTPKERKGSSPGSAESCDKPLNKPRRSERKSQVQLNSSFRLPWN